MQEMAKKTLEKVKASQRRGNLEEAESLLRRYLRVNPKDVSMTSELAALLMQREQFAQAVGVYGQLAALHPNNPQLLSNLGAALIRNGQPNKAKAILTQAITLDPKNVEARINLGGVLQALGDHKLAMTTALDAVALNPTHPMAFNNLGSAFTDLAMFSEAKHAYETSLMLDANQVDALINLASVESMLGNRAEAIRRYEEVLAILPPEAQHRREAVEFFASFEYLASGNLTKGWDCFEGGFSPMVPLAGARAPKRKFDVPRWRGEEIAGKRLLVWREQGIGDELLFATALQELESTGASVIVETDPRFVETFARSFPTFTVRAQAFNGDSFRADNNDFDLHIPIGSLMQIYRATLKDFERNRPYIVVDPQKKKKFMDRLAPYRDRKLVGFCWRSGKLSPTRNLTYTMVEDWVDVVSVEGYVFVSLQYGECSEELDCLESLTGKKIVRWNDLDLKDDLDDVFALMSCLDYVVSVGTAVFPMAGAVGQRALMLGGAYWPTFGDNKHYPFFPAARISGMLPGAAVPGELPKVSALLSDESFWQSP